MRSRICLMVLLLAACRDSNPVRTTREVHEEPPGIVERAFTPNPTPVPDSALDRAEEMVRSHVRREWFPGAALAVGNRALVQRVVAFGHVTWDSASAPASTDSTLYDLASLTKIVATTAALMALVEDGRLGLDDPVRKWVPRFSGGDKDSVTVRMLLTHTGGLRAGASDIASEVPGDVRRYLFDRPLALKPGADVLYSDLGFVVLWSVAQAAAGEPLPAYLRRRVWGPLGMSSTRVGVPEGCAACAPTLHLDKPGQEGPYTGGSYDEVGRRLDGLAGNAGAFSTARDLSRFAAAIANEGRLGNVRVWEKATVRAFVRPERGTRALGWEVYCREGKVPDQKECGEVYAFGHSGATGTSLWIDPASRTWAVLLTNRTYLPKHPDIDMQLFRRRLFEVLVP